MRTITFVLVTIFALSACGSPSGGTRATPYQGVLAGIAPASAGDKLRIGVEGAYPPFSWKEADGTLMGFDIEIAVALCEKMGRDCVFVEQDWDSIIPALMAKKYDAIIASMSITEERKKRVDFSQKYYNTPNYFVAATGSGIEISPEGLAGKAVGVLRGTIHQCFVEKMYPDADIRLYGTVEEVFLGLAAGRVDILIADGNQTAFYSLDNPDFGEGFEFVGDEQFDLECHGEGAGIAVRKGEYELRESFNMAIKAIRADGTYKAINDKYFSIDIYGFDLYGAEPGARESASSPATPKLVSTGTGFVVTGAGYVLTNHHVIDGCQTLRSVWGSVAQEVTLIASDRGNDLALLKQRKAGTGVAHFRTGRNVRSGDDVVVVGFPLRGLLASQTNVTTGIISATAGLGDDTRYLQITAPVQPGNSGGPLLDESGNVVGVVVSKLDALKLAELTGDIPQNINFAVKASVAQTFLDTHSVEYRTGTTATKLDAADIGEQARAFTVLVECWK